MASNIPFEIWSEVATYLPACDLKTLYPVNHAFFELAMAERYRAISFWDRRQAALNITRLEYVYSFPSFYKEHTTIFPPGALHTHTASVHCICGLI